MNIVSTVFGAAEKPILAFVENELVQNKAALIAEAKTYEASAIVAVGATVINTLEKDSTSPFFGVIATALAHAIAASEEPILAALGGADEAIFALLLHEVSLLAAP